MAVVSTDCTPHSWQLRLRFVGVSAERNRIGRIGGQRTTLGLTGLRTVAIDLG